jgi:hypothetical protein
MFTALTWTDVSSSRTEIAREGLEAWRAGDFEKVERILDPDVEWRWFEPGEWDCHGREDVMRTLRERYEQGFANDHRVLSAVPELQVALRTVPHRPTERARGSMIGHSGILDMGAFLS